MAESSAAAQVKETPELRLDIVQVASRTGQPARAFVRMNIGMEEVDHADPCEGIVAAIVAITGRKVVLEQFRSNRTKGEYSVTVRGSYDGRRATGTGKNKDLYTAFGTAFLQVCVDLD